MRTFHEARTLFRKAHQDLVEGDMLPFETNICFTIEHPAWGVVRLRPELNLDDCWIYFERMTIDGLAIERPSTALSTDRWEEIDPNVFRLCVDGDVEVATADPKTRKALLASVGKVALCDLSFKTRANMEPLTEGLDYVWLGQFNFVVRKVEETFGF